jgi:hypothetical protein
MGSSATQPVFENVCREIIQILLDDEGPLAKEYAHKALDLLHEFQSWHHEAPNEDRRRKAVQEVIDLHRQVQEYRMRKRTP